MSNDNPIDPMEGATSLTRIMATDYPKLEFVVDGLFPEGLGLIVAGSKIGKSWLVLQLGIQCAIGGSVLGQIPVAQRPVLYLALEDGERRIKDRALKLGVERHGKADDLTVMTRQPLDIQATIATFLARNAGRGPLVFLDTLGKARSEYFGRDMYQRDYKQTSDLQDLLEDHPGSSLYVVHHNNKADKSDFVDQVNGSTGLAGGADTIVVIQRSRHRNTAKLHVTGREAVEGVYALRMDDGNWTLDGDSLAQASERANLDRATSELSPDMAAVAQVFAEFEDGMTLKLASERLSNLEYPVVKKYASRLVEDGYLVRHARGTYGPGPKLSLHQSDKVTEVTHPGSKDLASDASVTSVTLSPNNEAAPHDA